MVGGVEHHALARPQRQHRLADRARVGALADGHLQFGGQLAVAHRRAAPRRIERELDFQYHGRDFEPVVGAPFEHAGAVTEFQLGAGHPAHLPAAAVQHPDPGEGVGDLGAVRPDVLDRGGPGRAGDAGQAFQPAQAVLDGGEHDVVPHRPRLGAHQIALDGDSVVGQPHRGQVTQRVGDHQVRAAGEHQHRITLSGKPFGVQPAQRGDHLFAAGTGDQPARGGSDPQRGQRRQRRRVGH
ncbi:hypothetical protein PICSAR164_04529 [Mycobacterium avium subsp. paratuberculosis]|nr:hypothetical protein PICSAR164_04529 [Mycobacterium avium subsp. paratuberculosis]